MELFSCNRERVDKHNYTKGKKKLGRRNRYLFLFYLLLITSNKTNFQHFWIKLRLCTTLEPRLLLLFISVHSKTVSIYKFCSGQLDLWWIPSMFLYRYVIWSYEVIQFFPVPVFRNATGSSGLVPKFAS